MADDTVVIDNSPMVLSEFQTALERALEECGARAETHAKDNVHYITGDLRNSISHKVVIDEKYAAVGTNKEYAIYEELGTGIYASEGGGRPTPWAYKDGKGKWHYTHGNYPHPYIKPSVSEHLSEYQSIIKAALKKGG